MSTCLFIFIEDSEQNIPNNNSLCSFGTLWTTKKELFILEKECLALRLKYNCWGELKWTNVDNNHLSLYKELIDTFASLEKIKFNSIISKTPNSKELDIYHNGDRLTSDMKLIWQVVAYNYFSYKNNFCKNRKLVLIADEPILEKGNHKDKLIKNFTNPRFISRSVPIKSATKAHSHISGALQLVDLLTGLSLAHACKHLYSSNFTFSRPKKELRDYALEKKLELNPILSGRPPVFVKVNNWFHLPIGRKISVH